MTTAAPAEQHYCSVGCTHPGQHLDACPNPDTCWGCHPRTTHAPALICGHCTSLLADWLDEPTNPESLTAITAWLGDNLGQHISHVSRLGRTHRRGDDRLATLTTIRLEIETVLAELADDFLASHHLTPPADPTPAAVAARLRPYQAMLHRWPPIIDHIPHLTQLVAHAHTACPWRDPTPTPAAITQAEQLLQQHPPVTARTAAQLLRLEPKWLYRPGCPVLPINPGQTPRLYRPYDIYLHLQQETA